MVHSAHTRTVEELTAIVDSVPTAIVMVDGAGRIELVNTQAERLFGYLASELHGEMIEVLVPFRFRQHHPALRAGFTASPTARPMGAGRDLFGRHKDGSEFPVEIGLSPIRTENGLFVVSAIVDISERKRLEARFRATVESAPTAMVMIDQAGTIVLGNTELERLFGYGEGQLLGRKIEDLLPKRFRDRHPGLRTQYLGAPQARRMGQGRDLFGLRQDGSEFPVEIGLNPVTTDEGSFVLAAIVDITERTRQADALRIANEALERSNIELQRFAYVASHDLQTPMRSIASFVELLQTTYHDQLDARAHDWIRRTRESVTQLQTLVRDLLEYSRVDSQAHPFEPVRFEDVVRDAATLLDASIREAGAELVCDPLPTVSGDRSQLVQLMLNLLGNALKYRADRPLRVHVSASESVPRGEWVFAVRDNGRGIASKHHHQVFEIFKRLHHHKDIPGTGIGLAVCRRVIHRHGGRIWLESEQGVGSTFLFTIPVHEAAAAQEQPAP